MSEHAAVIAAYRELDGISRDALAVIALLVVEPTSRSQMQDAVRAAEIVDDKGRFVQGPAFKTVVDTLTSSGALRVAREGYYQVASEWMPIVLDDAAKRGHLEAVARAMHRDGRRISALGYRSDYGREPSLGFVGDVRLALALGKPEAIARAFVRSTWATPAYDLRRAQDLLVALRLAPPRAWIDRMPAADRDVYLRAACDEAFCQAKRTGADLIAAAIESDDTEARGRAATILAVKGDHEAADRALDRNDASARKPWDKGARAFVALTRGSWDDARALFDAASTGSRGQRVELPSYLALFDLLLVGSNDVVRDFGALRQRIEKAKRSLALWHDAREALDSLVTFRATGRTQPLCSWKGATWMGELASTLIDTWSETKRRASEIDALSARAHTNGYVWLAERLDDLRLERPDPRSLVGLVTRRAAWELALDAIDAAAVVEIPPDRAPPARVTNASIHWEVDLSSSYFLYVTGHLVTARSRVGKPLSVQRLESDETLPIEACDRPIIDALVDAKHGGRSDIDRCDLAKLAGHPRVRDAAGGRPIAIETREAKVRVAVTNEGARLTLDPARFDDSGAAIVREEAKIVVVVATPLALRLLSVLGEHGLVVPASALGRVRATVAALSESLPIEADELVVHEAEAADARVRVQLFRAGVGLRARLRVVPGGAAGPAFRPGVAPETVMLSGADGLRRVRRSLAAEREDEARILARCPLLASLAADGDDRVARDLESCLELLLELGDAGVPVEWPEGQALRAPTTCTARDVRVRVRGGTTWFEVEGEVRVDETRVIAMKELLAAASRARGRFVAIGADEYLSLTDDVRAKLEAITRADGIANKGRMSMALLPAMEGWVEGFDVSWSDELERVRVALDQVASSKPRVPRGLAAELRDYQREGFVFLARRASASLGACLADDMGLGKTIQALALLLHRATRGPALVVAPTSVCGNWIDEAARFAPSLRFVRLGDTAGDRAQVIEGAGPGDVVVCSYGLLVAEQAKLTAQRWSTVVFDEAHALKNASTKRWAAARALDVEAALALTGTPVENHVGELHALFDVLVPGMLGTRAAFDRAFGVPLAEGDRNVASALRQVVRPFVMRRTKGEVLSELPPKTELTRKITPTAEHRAFYEVVRARAVERIAAARAATGARKGRAGIEMLAEITRLRRAAIDPRLVGGESAPVGCKIDALAELVVELCAEGRRALVFSQFLEVLDLAKAKLDTLSIDCRRLDGSMPASARDAEVAAFQAGEGDVFLLSLKAGGVGMNLTGADCVVHMDPWWNPAVEDQATDRAHRIGQSRPVTIVRLVTEGTIEDKVLALHGAKRQMARDVIGDADGTGTFDPELLAQLVGSTPHATREVLSDQGMLRE